MGSFKHLYGRKRRRWLYSDYYSVDLRALPAVIHILIGIIPSLSLLHSFYPYAIFVRGIKCNTLLPKYVLSYVFWFFNHIFWFASCIFFYFWIFMRSFCIGSGFVDSESALLWTGELILVYCSIWSFRQLGLINFNFKYHLLIF